MTTHLNRIKKSEEKTMTRIDVQIKTDVFLLKEKGRVRWEDEYEEYE